MTSRSQPTLCGWGRQRVPGRELRREDLEAASRDAVLSRGLGRSYGDASLPPSDHPEVLATPLADRILSFDSSSGLLRAEAGFALLDLVRLFLPRRWFIPVTPGTQYVTLGGMVAADVHGKNHHREGTLGRHVTSLRMRLASGEVVECSREERAELFFATLGGMGLTGHILEVELRLQRVPSPWIWQESERVQDLPHFLAALRAAGRDWPFTVGWIDSLAKGRRRGRGILIRGRWAEADEAPAALPRPRRRLSVPLEAPGWLLSRPTIRVFNEVYFRKHPRRVRRGIVHPESFFYPLDMVLHWNRLYGRRGLTQYQCVLPDPGSEEATSRFLELFVALGGASFLTVLKDFGEEGEGLLSFPRAGITLTLDIPVRRGTPELVHRLNRLVQEEGGRIYLAKDAFSTAEDFWAMEERLSRFLELRRRLDPEGRLRSAQSQRLLPEEAA